MRQISTLKVLLTGLALLAGCEADRMSEKGFSLPQGNAMDGQQVFVKRWGGVMTISVPEGQHHIAATWKEDHLWIENYEPETNTCYFREYSKGSLLQGKVTIKNCNPLMPQ